jgi:hypothetical protein
MGGNKIPFILGSLFLATTGATINCRIGEMKLTHSSDSLVLNIFQERLTHVTH